MDKETAQNANAGVTFEYGSHSVSADDLSRDVLIGLAGLGFTTKLKNATAGLKPAILGKTKDGAGDWTDAEREAGAKEMGTVLGAFPDLETFANEYCDWTVRKMYESILDGTVSFGSTRGPRLKGLDFYLNEIARELWAKVKAKVDGLTKDNEKKKFAKFLETNKDKFRPAAEERMAKAKELKDLDITI